MFPAARQRANFRDIRSMAKLAVPGASTKDAV